jgi:hypothetical protein
MASGLYGFYQLLVMTAYAEFETRSERIAFFWKVLVNSRTIREILYVAALMAQAALLAERGGITTRAVAIYKPYCIASLIPPRRKNISHCLTSGHAKNATKLTTSSSKPANPFLASVAGNRRPNR